MEKIRKKHSFLNVKEKSFLIVAGTILLGMALVITGFPGITIAAGPKVIKIGSIQPATGMIAEIGQACRRGNLLAVEDINARGGIKSMGGAKLELLLGDSEGKPPIGRSEAERLIKNGSVCLVGAFMSSVTMAIATLAEQRGVPFVIDIAAADPITQQGYKHVFRNFTKSSVFGRCYADYIKDIIAHSKVPIKRAVLMNIDDLFGTVTAKFTLKALKDKNVPIDIVAHITFPHAAKDISTEVAKAKAAKPDILIPIVRIASSRVLLKELYKQKVKLLGIVAPGCPGFYEPEFFKDMRKLANFIMDSPPWINPKSSMFKEVNARYQKKFNKGPMDTNSAYAYEGVMIIADALERAKSTEPDKIVAALRKTNIKEHITLGGPIVFDKNGDNPNAITGMLQNLNGRTRLVLPREFAEVDYVFPTPNLWER
ncbi:MAG: ABC transporter substrate-binding protein [Deltaproteobacteria bacterium]|nr:ABC transporter substrate-binding protein [Deltaproteobacteria bacterium]MBW2114102.1 ABC transporter substrate-binding protein [Deltaproteobacteria bacterium]MBW2357220.1 ABC transporter substrate-binding protein [Deltaproteobacteria bacterium]